MIGDAILFYLDEDLFNLVGRPSAHNWVQYHGETGGYDVEVGAGRALGRRIPTGRELYRYPGPGTERARGAGRR